MGIQVEFNPDLALRNISEFKNGNRKFEECVPENMIAGNVYHFLKKGQRLYWMFGDVSLIETAGNDNFSQPLANVLILEVRHVIENDEVWTIGKYRVSEVFQKTEDEKNKSVEMDLF
ncbi:hypothetical protein KKC32_00490 [Patescibacteria group bacterium]|nr:hypothetical protein [Patescibacteria group bacterium]